MEITRRTILKALGLSFAGTEFPIEVFAREHRAAAYQQPATASAFDHTKGEWSISWPERVSQYDLVYKSPPIDPFQGMPVGNGDIGVLLWCEGSKIILAVNKSDLWDDADFEKFSNWKKEEEDISTTLRHAGRIEIDFNFPFFDTLFLSSFDGRLKIADGSISMTCSSPFGTLSFEFFTDYKSGCLLMSVRTDLHEEAGLDIAVERFGSRTFSHWYSQINRDASIGTTGTSSSTDESGAYIEQALDDKKFAFGGRVLDHEDSTVAFEREHSHRSVIRFGKSRKKTAQLAFAVTSPEKNDVTGELKKKLQSVKQNGVAAYKESNAREWKSLWTKSFMDYGDVYLNHLWHMTIFYAITSQGGKYPGRFNNGMWSWNRDVQNWNFYFHWNQQQLYWPLNAAGLHQLVDPYLDYRFRSLPMAEKDAREHFNADGAYISDVAERRGFNSVNELHNHTPVAEVALDFWRQYQYTQDKKFLREKAVPMLTAAAKFFVSLFIKEADGYYHAKEGTGYEGWIKLKDGLTELVYGRVIFSTAIKALEEAGMTLPDQIKWKEILDHLTPVPLMDAGQYIKKEGENAVLQTGYFKGTAIKGKSITPAGWGIAEKKWLTVYHADPESKYFGMKLLDGIFPTVASSLIFPSNMIGLSQKETQKELFQAAQATALLYAPGITGWDPLPIVLARLGMADELAKVLSIFPGRWQIYCNGWGHWGLEGEINKDAEWFFRTNNVRDAASSDNQKFQIRMWPFRHMSMESMSVFATAVNESLIQSHDGIVRIAPALPANASCRFTLHATGALTVSAEITKGSVMWINVKSAATQTCRIALPWKDVKAYAGGKKVKVTVTNGIARFTSEPDKPVTLVPAETSFSWSTVAESPKRNNDVRTHASGKAQLGLQRLF